MSPPSEVMIGFDALGLHLLDCFDDDLREAGRNKNRARDRLLAGLD
jgi:hypothetical protein